MTDRFEGRFDDRYYRRFYGKGGAHDRERVAHLAASVHHMAAWWEIEITSVLDVGAGMGFWRDWYREEHPEVQVTSVDISEHACATWGHEQRDIATWKPTSTFDLVICHSVLQYMDDDALPRAINHLCDATGHLLYLEVPTKDDLAHMVDPKGTDLDVHHRNANAYRRHLDPRLNQVGAGLWVHPDSTPMYELEALG